MLEVAFVVVSVFLGAGEFYVWHAGLLWHEPKKDPRNFPPRW
jgi:hypothetical protein